MGLFRQGCLVSVVALLLPGARAHDAKDVLVAAVHFPPYVIRPEQGVENGLLPRLVEALNRRQSEFHFSLRPTSLGRRFDDFKAARYDIAFFESPRWSWRDVPSTPVDMGLEDAEVYVARAQAGRSQHYFSELPEKRLALFNGYHYGFAEFNNDPAWLAAQFDVRLTYSQESNLRMVLRDRVDIALVTRSWLNDQRRANPELDAQLLISAREDQRYRHHALLRPGAPIAPERFQALMNALRSDGSLHAIFEPLGIRVTPQEELAEADGGY